LCGNGIRGRLLTALRLPAVLVTAGAVVVVGLIARELGCDRRAQVFTAAAQATGLWSTLAGHWLTPYSLEPVQWMLLVWLLIRWQRVRDDRLLLVLGVVIGIAAMTKFQVMLLCLVLLVAIAVGGPRDLLGRPLLWAGAALAVLIAAPTLIWQYLHGWPQLRMTPVVAGEAEALYGGRTGTADAYHALPSAQRGRTVIIGESYIVAAFLDGVAPKYQLPTSYSTNRSYGYYPAATRRPRRGALRRT
jgi:Dolichyl-phosphate-mannose-protein mannosyltransferase